MAALLLVFAPTSAFAAAQWNTDTNGMVIVSIELDGTAATGANGTSTFIDVGSVPAGSHLCYATSGTPNVANRRWFILKGTPDHVRVLPIASIRVIPCASALV